MEHAEDDRRNADCPDVHCLHDVLRPQEAACVQSDIGRVHDGDPPCNLFDIIAARIREIGRGSRAAQSFAWARERTRPYPVVSFMLLLRLVGPGNGRAQIGLLKDISIQCAKGHVVVAMRKILCRIGHRDRTLASMRPGSERALGCSLRPDFVDIGKHAASDQF
jgi:hypothetical protein